MGSAFKLGARVRVLGDAMTPRQGQVGTISRVNAKSAPFAFVVRFDEPTNGSLTMVFNADELAIASAAATGPRKCAIPGCTESALVQRCVHHILAGEASP